MARRSLASIRPSPARLTRLRTAGLWRERTLPAALRATVARQPGAALLVDGAVVLNAAGLLARAEALASGLVGLGVGRGDVVAYQLPNWWEAAITLLGASLAGATVVPVVDILRARELRSILDETRPKVVVVAASHRNLDGAARVREALAPETRSAKDSATALPLDLAAHGEASIRSDLPGWLAPTIVVARQNDEVSPTTAGTVAFEDLLRTPARSDLPEPDPAQIAVVIYTSGSTAAPRGAMHSHETLDAELRSLVEVHGLGPGDATLMPSPVGHISGVIHGILAPALLGTRAVFLDRWDPDQAVELIEAERITYMIGVPTLLQQILDAPSRPQRDLSSLRLFSCGGARVPPELIRRARMELPGLVAKRVYGSSEFPTIATTTAEDALARGGDTEGRAMPGVEIRICDEAGQTLPPGEEGEIRARGPDLFIGWVDPALDAETLDPEGFLCTGDLGVLDGDGYLRVTGRVKDIIIRKGEKFSARELEDLLDLHPAVQEAAVIALPDSKTGERACACLKLRPGAPKPSLADLISFLRLHDLTPQKLPEQLALVADFPRTPSGKIDKRRLRSQLEGTCV